MNLVRKFKRAPARARPTFVPPPPRRPARPAEPLALEPRTVEVVTLVLTAGRPAPIVNAKRWLRVTFSSPSSGVRISNRASDAAGARGFTVDTEPVTIEVAPGSSLYAGASADGAEISAIIQPLPLSR